METIDQSKLVEMPIDQFKEYLQTLKAQYDQVKQSNNDLNEKLHRQMRKEQRMKEEQKQAILQAETVNMMTKYQLVFVKMENAFAKIFHTNKCRNLKFKQDCFQQIRLLSLVKSQSLNYKTHLVYEKLKNQTLARLLNKYEKKNSLLKHLAFEKWKIVQQIPKIKQQCELQQSKELEVLQQKKLAKEKEQKEKDALTKEKEQKYKQMQQQYKELSQQIHDREVKERNLSQEIQSLVYKNATSAVEGQKGSTNVISRVQLLESELQQSKRENKALKEKLDMTEINMQTFMREMGGLIDQHDLSEVLNDILHEDYAAMNGGRGRNDEEGGGSTGVWQVSVGVNDIDLDPQEHGHVDKQQLGFYVSLGQKLHDVLVLSSGQNTVKVTLPQDSNDRVTIVVKSLGRDEFKVGSISIPQEVFVNGGEGKHKQWVTLFDHIDDDEYDGEMGDHDDEAPRVQFTFHVQQETIAKPKPLQTPQPTQTKAKSNYNSTSSVNRDSAPNTLKKTPQVVDNPSKVQQTPPSTTTYTRRTGRDKQSSGLPSTGPTSIIQPKSVQVTEYSTPTITSSKVPTMNKVTPPKLSPIKSHYMDDFDILREISKEPSKKYKLEFLQKMLDDKLGQLIRTISDSQNENQVIENDVLQRLNLLKTLNTQIESSYKEQSSQANKIQGIYTKVKGEHQHLLENDTHKLALDVKFNELEKTLASVKVEVEQTAIQNEKLKLVKDERLSSDLNKRIFVDRKENEQLRDQIKDIEEKRQNQRDQERDYNRDIYQLAKEFKRKVDEYHSLLTNYANERNALLTEIQIENNEIVTEEALREIDNQRGSKDKGCISIHQEQIKQLELQIEDKKKQGEEIYNQMRDQVSFQEDRIKQSRDEIAKLKGNHNQKLEQEQIDHEHDIERLKEALKDKISDQDLMKCEQELEKASQYREKTRKDLVAIKKRLEVVVDIQIFEADLEEIEILSAQIRSKDQELLLTAMKARDTAKKHWLKNWVNIEVHELMRRDRDDIRNHIEMYSDDLSKLSKIIEKFQHLQINQQEKCQQGGKELKLLESEMKLLNEERTECEKELKKLDIEYQSKKAELAQKQKDLVIKDKKTEQTVEEIELSQIEIDKLNEILDVKDSILMDLEQRIKRTGAAGIAASLYNAIKGDLVDELLAKYINLTSCPVPIKRLGNGYYLFGTKKIFAKIMNGKLVIRVGGGFMVIEEFIAAYAESELKKMLAIENADSQVDDLSGKAKGYGSNRKSPRGGPLQGSPRDAFAKKGSNTGLKS